MMVESDTYDLWGPADHWCPSVGEDSSFTAVSAEWSVDSNMTKADLVFLDKLGKREDSFSLEVRRRKLIALSARIGVWGVITGLASIAFGALAPLAAISLAGIGFFAGGLGAMGTSVLVVKDLRRASWPLRLAAVLGLPFGACLVTFVCGAFWQWPLPIALVSLSVPVGAILGVMLMILLLTGLLSHGLSGPRTGWED
ncbi:MAG: hypothetical protein HKO65_08950 [Gemmatimonadetes bacterium]|nr:hypothetical protein [Gemmatimonadota bacterium]NNM05216.1 hypothetical protein [Gemmatimonadota bacterium]